MLAPIAGGAPQNSQDADRAAIDKAVQGYMDSWNTHNVHASGDDVHGGLRLRQQFWRRDAWPRGMEKTFGPFMTGVYSETHQTGNVKSIRFLKPDVAAVDVDWEMTGAKNQDGTVRPTRKGLHSLIMTKQADGSWLIADDARARIHGDASDHKSRAAGTAACAIDSSRSQTGLGLLLHRYLGGHVANVCPMRFDGNVDARFQRASIHAQMFRNDDPHSWTCRRFHIQNIPAKRLNGAGDLSGGCSHLLTAKSLEERLDR